MAAVTRKPILISGAGLASLLLAQSLLRSSIPFVLFERDQSISFRAQGYRLRLSAEGLDAIQTVLGPDFQRFLDRCGKTGGSKGLGVLNAITGEEYEEPRDLQQEKAKEENGSWKPTKEQLTSRGGLTIGISRGEMRFLFFEEIEQYVRWGHNVAGYELTADGVRAVFSDGSKSEEGELLVGGEGIYSKVAKQLSKGKLKTYDTGARGIHGQAPSTAFEGLGEGVWRLVDDTNPAGRVFIITNVRPRKLHDPHVQFGWTMGGQPGVIKPPNDDFAIVGKQAADLAKSLTSKWCERVRPLFEQMNEASAAFWKITCSTPTGIPEWETESRVTLIGDAVHSMTPAGGNGANTALRDSALLGSLLGEAGGYKDGITAAYERRMREYASDMVRNSYEAARVQFGIQIDPETSPVVG